MSDEIKRIVVNSKSKPAPSDEGVAVAEPAIAKASPINTPTSNMSSSPKVSPLLLTIGAIVVVVMGSLTGYGLSRVGASQAGGEVVAGVDPATGQLVSEEIKPGDVVGDLSKKGDVAEGVLKVGGINGEGSHRILRPGGKSQTVYLTSSVVDLNQFAGHKVKIWGDTFAAQTAGWLMDVLTLEVVELNAPDPFEE